METPIIVRVYLEPFCPACGAELGMQGDRIGWTADGADLVDRVVVVELLCPGCGRRLEAAEVAWREKGTRDKEER